MSLLNRCWAEAGGLGVLSGRRRLGVLWLAGYGGGTGGERLGVPRDREKETLCQALTYSAVAPPPHSAAKTLGEALLHAVPPHLWLHSKSEIRQCISPKVGGLQEGRGEVTKMYGRLKIFYPEGTIFI